MDFVLKILGTIVVLAFPALTIYTIVTGDYISIVLYAGVLITIVAVMVIITALIAIWDF